MPGGKVWSEELREALFQSKAGVICVTPNNAGQPWPVAEFVWLWRERGTPVVPLLLAGARQTNLSGPMAAVRGVDATNKEQVLGMLIALGGFPSDRVPADLKQGFEREWPRFKQFIAGVGSEVPDREFEIEAQSPENAVAAITPLVKDFALPGFDSSLIRVRVFLARACIAVGILALAGITFAFTPVGKKVLADALRALGVANGEAVPAPLLSAASNAVVFEQRVRQLQITNAWLADSNATLASQVGQLQQRLQAAQATVTNVTFVTNVLSARAAGGSNALLALPTSEINLRSITTNGLSSVPVAGEWLLFIPRNRDSQVPLYASNGPGRALGALEFGVPYQVTATFQETNVLLEAAHEPGVKGWLRGWADRSDAIVFRVGTNGLRIPNWRFVPEREGAIPGLTPSRLTNNPMRLPPPGVPRIRVN
jgi:hypothetical protein